MNLCAVCNAPSTKQCAACLRVYYCSKEHQKQDWKDHKASTCLPYKIKEDALRGQHVVAARQLAAGDLVLKETRSISGTGLVSSVEQSCIANCYKINKCGESFVRAAQPIAPGEHLSLCFPNPFEGTRERLHFLNGVNATCICSRCLDPTEMGTHFSSLKCQKTGCSGFLVPPDNNLFSFMPWKCQICHEESSALKVKKLISSVRAALSSVDKTNFAECQDFINRFEPYLHENHYLLTEVRIAAVTDETNASNFTKDEWRVQLRYCRQLDQLLLKIARAQYSSRSVILFRLGVALFEVNGDDSTEEAKQLGVEAWDLLKHDPGLPDIILGVNQLQMKRRLSMSAAGH